jgi:predicted RNA-binding Zn ribbon-like protein
MWEWLGEPLAADFANTTKRHGNEERECLRSGADLATWSRLEDEVPDVDAGEADARLAEVLALRGAVVEVLHAAVRGEPADAATAERVNAAARMVPIVGQLRDGAVVREPAARAAPLDELLARVAAATIELAGGRGFVGFCDAPSCGQFFAGGRSGRRWCSDSCGTRARVARHARRH